MQPAAYLISAVKILVKFNSYIWNYLSMINNKCKLTLSTYGVQGSSGSMPAVKGSDSEIQ